MKNAVSNDYVYLKLGGTNNAIERQKFSAGVFSKINRSDRFTIFMLRFLREFLSKKKPMTKIFGFDIFKYLKNSKFRKCGLLRNLNYMMRNLVT